MEVLGRREPGNLGGGKKNMVVRLELDHSMSKTLI